MEAATAAAAAVPHRLDRHSFVSLRSGIPSPDDSPNGEIIITFVPDPTIGSQPTSQTVFVGFTATFNVMANGTLPISYQWLFNWTNITGATNTTLTLTNVQLNQAGNYAVLVTNAYGSVLSSNAVLTVFSRRHLAYRRLQG